MSSMDGRHPEFRNLNVGRIHQRGRKLFRTEGSVDIGHEIRFERLYQRAVSDKSGTQLEKLILGSLGRCCVHLYS